MLWIDSEITCRGFIYKLVSMTNIIRIACFFNEAFVMYYRNKELPWFALIDFINKTGVEK